MLRIEDKNFKKGDMVQIWHQSKDEFNKDIDINYHKYFEYVGFIENIIRGNIYVSGITNDINQTIHWEEKWIHKVTPEIKLGAKVETVSQWHQDGIAHQGVIAVIARVFCQEDTDPLQVTIEWNNSLTKPSWQGIFVKDFFSYLRIIKEEDEGVNKKKNRIKIRLRKNSNDVTKIDLGTLKYAGVNKFPYMISIESQEEEDLIVPLAEYFLKKSVELGNKGLIKEADKIIDRYGKMLNMSMSPTNIYNICLVLIQKEIVRRKMGDRQERADIIREVKYLMGKIDEKERELLEPKIRAIEENLKKEMG